MGFLLMTNFMTQTDVNSVPTALHFITQTSPPSKALWWPGQAGEVIFTVAKLPNGCHRNTHTLINPFREFPLSIGLKCKSLTKL